MSVYLNDPDVRLYHGDALDVLRGLPDGSVDCCVTSPPYWGLRDYGNDGQLGLEATPDEFVAAMVAVFQEVRRVLADHGTCFVNLGDSYASGEVGRNDNASLSAFVKSDGSRAGGREVRGGSSDTPRRERRTKQQTGLKPKDLVGIPWRVAFALQADGWYLRSDIVWAKPNPMPESVTDRPTKSHEYVFLLTKRPRYFFDQESVREPAEWARWGDQTVGPGSNPNGWIKPRSKESLTWDERKDAGEPLRQGMDGKKYVPSVAERGQGRNVRSVWTIATQPYPEAHFATFPEELARRCIVAGCPTRVCRACGKPSERIVEKELVDVWHRNKKPTKAAHDLVAQEAGDQASRRARDGHVSGHAIQATTLGWTDCECPADGIGTASGVSGGYGIGGDFTSATPDPCEADENQHAAAPGSGASSASNWRPGVVLDPFSGSGTVAKVARDHQRHAIGIDLNEQYLELAARRLQQLSLLSEA